MKKIFLVLFFITFFGTFLFAEIENGFPDKNLMKGIDNYVNKLLYNDFNSTYHKEPSVNANFSSVFHISFTRNSLVESNNKQKLITTRNGCVAVALNETWLLVSNHCFLDKSIKDQGLNELKNIDKIIDIKYTDFNVTDKNKHISAVAHKLSNLYLLQLIDGNKLENTTSFPYLLISTTKDETKLLNTFNDGRTLINRTVRNEEIWSDNFFTKNFDPYYVHRNVFSYSIKKILLNNYTAILSGIFGFRAGDPMFYIKDGKEYISGFGDALNIPDTTFQTDISRTNNVTLFSLSDRNEIITTIRIVDKSSADNIARNTVFK